MILRARRGDPHFMENHEFHENGTFSCRNVLGEAKSEFRCCAIHHDLVNENEETKFYIDGTCYQLGIFCPCCKSVRFLVNDENIWRF